MLSKNHNKYNNIFPRIVDKENIYRAYKKSLEGDSKYALSAMAFTQDETYNKKKIKCKKTLKLLYIIIDSADVLGPLGLPLGNSTSQNFANIYMNELDQYCKRKLGLKYYVRYMDDFFIFVNGKEKAKEVLDLIVSFLKKMLKLTLSETKTKYLPIIQGLNAIGFKTYITHKLLRNDSKKRIKRKVQSMPSLVINKGLLVSKTEQMINSWKGHADYAESNSLYEYLTNKHDFLLIKKNSKRNIFKINKEVLYINHRQFKTIQLNTMNLLT